MHPYAAICVKCSCPDTCTAEKIVAEQLSHVACVILEPLEVELSDAVDLVLAVLYMLAEVYSEVTMLPVSTILHVLSVVLPCLRSAA